MKSRSTYVLAAILVLASIYFYQDPGVNGNSRLELTKAVVEQGTFQIDAYQNEPGWRTIDRAYFEGHYYTDKGIGSSLLALPPYFVLYRLAGALGVALSTTFVKHVLTVLVMGGAFVLLGLMLYWIALEISGNPWQAFIVTLALELGTMLWPYSAVYFGHLPAAAFLTAGFLLLFRMKNTPEATGLGSTFLAGVMLGAAFITDYTTSLIIGGMMVYALHALWKQDRNSIFRSGAAGALGALIPLSLMIAYNLVVYRTGLAFGYSHETMPQFEAGHQTGFMGINLPDPGALYHLTLDPKFGVFWQSPVLLLAIVGYYQAFKNRLFRAETLLSLYAVLSILLMNAGFYMWWGGATFGPRLLIVALPFLIVPLALVPRRLGWLVVTLGVVSGAQMLIPLMGRVGIGVDFDTASHQFLVGRQPFNGFSIMYEAGVPLIFKWQRNAPFRWDLGSALGMAEGVSLMLFLVAEGTLIAWFRRLAAMEAPAGISDP